MNFNHLVKRILERLFGIRIYRSLPFGLDVFNDIRVKLPNTTLRTFMDVGANVGDYAKYIKKNYPNARVYCIEPISETFEKLRNNLKSYQIQCDNIALGSTRSEIEVVTNVQHSTMISLSRKANLNAKPGTKTDRIHVITLQEYCTENKVTKIDFLKIDTEGFDLEVLKGAEELLKNGSISFIQVEAGMNKNNQYHVPLFDIKDYLEKFDYYMFGIYEQFHEWSMSVPVLRRCDAVFTLYKSQ